MNRASGWIKEYWKGIVLIISSLLIGFLFGQAKIYVGIPERLNKFDERLKKVEIEHVEVRLKQEKTDEHQDIEIRLNSSEINGLRLEITALRAETNTNTRLLEEVRADIKKLLQKE